MKVLKKIIATIALVSITIASTVVNAAPLDNATANVTLSNDITTEVLTVNVPSKDFASDNANYVEITDNNWNTVYTGSTITSNVWEDFTVDMDFDTVLNTTTRYTISFTTVWGDFGAAVLVINQDNVLTVTATVQPVLKFAIEDNNANFGVLTTTSASITRWIEVWTNAINWVTVTAKTVNGWLKSTTAWGHTIWLNTNDTLYSDEAYSFTSNLGGSDSAVWAVIAGMVESDIVAANDEFTVYTADMPQNFDATTDYDTDFTISTKIAESTPSASDYTDVIIFTATANF